MYIAKRDFFILPQYKAEAFNIILQNNNFEHVSNDENENRLKHINLYYEDVNKKHSFVPLYNDM